MAQRQVLVRERIAVNAEAAGAVAAHKVSALDHKVFDDTVECAVFVAYGLAVSAVFSYIWCERRGEKVVEKVYLCKIDESSLPCEGKRRQITPS